MGRTMTLQEEKKYVQRVQQLKKEKPKLEQKQRKLEELERQKDEAGVMKKPIQAQLDDLNEAIKKSKEAKEVKFKQLADLRAERDSKMGGAKELIDQRKAMKELIDAEYEKIRKLRDEYKKVNDTHWKW